VQDQPNSIKPGVLAVGGILFAAGLAVGLLVSRFFIDRPQQPAPAQPALSPPSAEEKFVSLANAKQAALESFLKTKDSSFSNFKATITEEKEDVQIRATFPYQGKIEFTMGVEKRKLDPDGKGSSQMGCRVVSTYQYVKKDERWVWAGGFIPPNQFLPKEEERIVAWRDVEEILANMK
jgi:hypothetical protein